MIITDKWREPTSERLYSVTGKEPPEAGWDFGGRRYAYWMLVGRIEEKFGSTPITMRDIYYEVTAPLGLSSSDTVALVKGAVKEGYLK